MRTEGDLRRLHSSARDALRRPLPLRRSLPQPLPPRAEREVPRLGARARLDARAADRPDGRLHGRLLGVAEGGLDIDHYPLFLLSGLVTWVFFQGALQSSCTSLLGQASLVKQVRFPRQLLPFAVVATNAVTLLVMLAVIIPVNLIFVPETRSTFWAGIPLVLPLVALAGSLALVLAAVTVIFRDVEHLLDGGASALVLPDADLLHLRPAGDRQPSEARRLPPLRESCDPLRPGDSRPALLRAASARRRRRLRARRRSRRRSSSRRPSSGGSTTSSRHISELSTPLLVRAARLEPVERTPVWFMRQAGRSLPGYREIRKRHNLFEVCRRPELCAEVTLEPVRVHGVDAAVMFADIMLPILGMGIDVELVENVGPVIDKPVRSAADVEALRVPDPEEAVPFILEAVRLVRSQLEPERALVGFCGGPFTVAGYLVEGKPTRDFVQTKRCMYGSPEVWHGLMEKLTETSIAYLRAKVDGGRRRRPALRLLDRRALAGRLRGVRRALLRSGSSRRSTSRRSTSGPARRTCSRRWRAAGGDVIGLDWRVRARRSLAAGRPRPGRAGQPRPGAAARALRADARRRRSGSSSSPAAARATSSTSGTASCRRPIPRTWGASSSSCTSRPRRSPREARGRPHGLREPVGPGGRAGLSRGHPRRASRSRRARSRSWRSVTGGSADARRSTTRPRPSGPRSSASWARPSSSE